MFNDAFINKQSKHTNMGIIVLIKILDATLEITLGENLL